MNKTNILKSFTLAMLALVAIGATSAHAQYTVTGATAGGGKVIVGNGSLPALGPGAPLSAGGFDQVTLNIGSMATGSGQDTISFATSNDTLINNGAITADSGFNAVTFNTAVLSGESVTNNGSMTGGGGASNGAPGTSASGASGGTAMEFFASSSMSGITVANNGSVSGGFGFGNGGSGGVGLNGGNGGSGGTAMEFISSGVMNGITVINNSSISGGFGFGNGGAGGGAAAGGGGGIAGSGGAAMEFISSGAMGGITVINNGSVSGGSGVGAGGVGGTGGGGGGGAGGDAGSGGAAMEFISSDAMGGITVINNSSVSGGSGSGSGGAGGTGGGGPAGSGGSAGSGGAAMEFLSGGAMSGITVANFGSATGGSSSGNGGDQGSFGAFGGNGGNAGDGGAAMEFVSSGAMSGVIVDNFGSAIGGSSSGTAGAKAPHGSPGNPGSGGAGIMLITAIPGGGNLTVNNFGTVAGGAGMLGGVSGYGIESIADNLTINNWGTVSAGAGTVEVGLPAGFPAVAISISGNNNTINLNGHSSVNGTIQGGVGSNNVLNLNFTGVSPFVAGNLKVQLMSPSQPTPWQGNGTPFVGTITIRGDSISVDPLNVFLNVTSYEGQALTPNQFAIGVVLDGATVNPAPGSSLFNLFSAIDLSGNVPGALEALSPQKYEVYGDIAIENSTALVQEIDNRLANLREGSENIDTTGMGGGTTTLGLTKDDSKDGKESKEVVPAQEKRWGFFATGNGLFFRGNSNNVDFQEGKADTVGTVAGVDAKAGDHAVIGALFAYDNTSATLGTDGSHANIESYTPGIYGAFNMDGFYVNGLAAYTRNNYSSSRNIQIPNFLSTASASANSNQYTVNMDGGYDWKPTDRLSAGPLAGVQYVHLDINGFNESGAGAASLAVGSQNVDSLQSRVGGHINYHLQMQANVAGAVDVHAAWQHEYLNDSRGIGASFIGTGLTPFSIQTAAPQRDAGVVGASVNFTFKDRVTLFADYDLLMWSSSYFEQTVNGGFRISF